MACICLFSTQVNQISGGVTIVKVGGSRPDLQQSVSVPNQQLQPAAQPISSPRQHPDMGGCWLNRQEVNRLVITRPRLGGDSRSTGRLHTSVGHRSMTRLNIGKLLFHSFLTLCIYLPYIREYSAPSNNPRTLILGEEILKNNKNGFN